MFDIFKFENFQSNSNSLFIKIILKRKIFVNFNASRLINKFYNIFNLINIDELVLNSLNKITTRNERVTIDIAIKKFIYHKLIKLKSKNTFNIFNLLNVNIQRIINIVVDNYIQRYLSQRDKVSFLNKLQLLE